MKTLNLASNKLVEKRHNEQQEQNVAQNLINEDI